jgi:hypothetical protein
MRFLMKTLFALSMVVLVFAAVAVDASTFGINAHVPSDRVADEIVEAGIGWVRVDVVWSAIEPERDVYDWARVDALIDRLEARGLRIYAVLGSTPAWATSGLKHSGVPDDPAEWREFCYLVSARYQGRVDAWGIWNEPNLDRFWEGTRNDYIEVLLLPGAEAIHAADPKALICAADLAHLSSAHWDGWLYDVVTRAGYAIDVVTLHLYPSYGRADEVTYDLEYKPRLPFTSPSIHKALMDAGWWGRPCWLTETGIESGRYGEAAQADYFEGLLGDWFGPHPAGHWIDRIFFYHMYDGKPPTTTSFGIIESRSELVRKSAFVVYQNFISAASVDDAEIIGHGFPVFVDSNTDVEIPVMVRNTGNSVWSPKFGQHLDITSDIRAWDVSAAPLADGHEVVPGETVDFLVRLKTWPDPLRPQSSIVTFDLRMAAKDGRRFGDPLRTTVTFTDFAPPDILTNPRSVRVARGRQTFFSVDVDSDTPVRYSWRRNGVELRDHDGISGSTTRRLRVRGVNRHSEGDYDCVITNDAGSIATRPAALIIGGARLRRHGERATP